MHVLRTSPTVRLGGQSAGAPACRRRIASSGTPNIGGRAMTTAILDSMLEFQKAVQSESLRTLQRWMNMPKVPEIARDVEVGTTPHEVVYEEDSLKLLRYRNEHSI